MTSVPFGNPALYPLSYMVPMLPVYVVTSSRSSEPFPLTCVSNRMPGTPT